MFDLAQEPLHKVALSVKMGRNTMALTRVFFGGMLAKPPGPARPAWL
jgi:hypothetical protein